MMIIVIILVSAILTLAEKSLGAHNIREAPFVPATMDLDSVIAAMRSRRTQMAVVIDECGGTAGIITAGDLFQEIITEIDTCEIEKDEISPDGKRRLCVRGTVRLDELSGLTGLSLEHEKVLTLSGLIMLLLGRAPGKGDFVRYRGVEIEVKSIDGHAAGDCIITVEPPGQPDFP